MSTHEHEWVRRPVYKWGRSIYTCECGEMAQDENEEPTSPGKLIPVSSVDAALDAIYNDRKREGVDLDLYRTFKP